MIPTVFHRPKTKASGKRIRRVFIFFHNRKNHFHFVFGLTFGLLLTTLDTVAMETFASFAISYIFTIVLLFVLVIIENKLSDINHFTGQTQNSLLHYCMKFHTRFPLKSYNQPDILHFHPSANKLAKNSAEILMSGIGQKAS